METVHSQAPATTGAVWREGAGSTGGTTAPLTTTPCMGSSARTGAPTGEQVTTGVTQGGGGTIAPHSMDQGGGGDTRLLSMRDSGFMWSSLLLLLLVLVAIVVELTSELSER